ncbi:MAG TPA: toll/interleukin-1 receptor domain-containing protein, partial [Gemmataceae bacterium]|nr:toll/interleukin-1 receptor domain-containing protein [Gemmataceae bacterium]
MAADQNEYEIFISYARLDNRPIPPNYPLGWVTALRDHILADQRRYSTEPLRIFFDTSEIKDMDDWRHRILGGLRHSKILLVCLSPNYSRSGPCRWEWDEYLKRQTHQLMGMESIATVYFVEVPGSDEQDNAKRVEELMRGNFTDLRPWFPAGARMMQEEEVKRRLDSLGLSLHERIDRARRARGVPGNVRRTNPFFVGRREELRRLHEQLGVGAIGVVTAVHGLGGQGKTELAYHYANGFADCYQGGLWSLGAEGKKELLPLLGELAFVPAFGYSPSDAEKADANLLGQRVLEELRKQCAASTPLHRF